MHNIPAEKCSVISPAFGSDSLLSIAEHVMKFEVCIFQQNNAKSSAQLLIFIKCSRSKVVDRLCRLVWAAAVYCH